MLRKKICSMLAAIMIATSVLGNIQIANATELSEIKLVDAETEKVIEDGEYTVSNETEYVEVGNATGESMARRALKNETSISVKDGKVMMTLYFSDSLYVFMKDIVVSLDGQDLQGFNDVSTKSITFEVPSVDVKVKVDMNITMMGRDVSFYVTNDTSELLVVEDKEDEDIEVALADGTYKIKNKTLKSGGDDNSSMRNYIDTESIVTVKDGKLTVTMKYNEAGLETVKATNSITIDGQQVEFNKNEDGSISFEIESVEVLYTRINVSLTYHNEGLPEAIFPGKLHTVIIDLLHEGELTKVEEDNSGDNGSNSGDNNGNIGGDSGSDNGGDSNNGDSGVVQGAKTYTVKNEVTHENSTGVAMARQYLNKISKFEEVNGKNYVTLTFTGTDLMKDHEIYVNGTKVNATKAVNGDETSIRFEVASIDNSINVSLYVIPMGRSIEFGVSLLKDTLTLVDGSNDSNDSNDTGNSGTNTGNNNSSNGGSATEGTVSGEATKEETVNKTVKVYSIQNNVAHESETGVSMARKYLSATSKVEEIEGEYYITLTFTGSEFMQNHEIYVNGVKVSESKSVSGDETYIRFAVSSLSDDIKVKVYVVPMAREVEFGVELLEDTLTLIKEYTVESLPNTGAAVGGGAVAGLGLILTSAGTVLLKKRK